MPFAGGTLCIGRGPKVGWDPVNERGNDSASVLRQTGYLPLYLLHVDGYSTPWLLDSEFSNAT
jgi:hypothetical protein